MRVSVCMITYNHREYIAEAIMSIVKQKTNFIFELIIGDDHSTDGTKDEILKLKAIYPDIIKPEFREKNIGMTMNFLETIKKCEGNYVAFCEGDDYWTDSLKLQKQVQYLEFNTDCGMVFTNHYSQYEFLNNILVENRINITADVINSPAEILKHNFIGTQTVMVRKNILNDSLTHLELGRKNWPSCDTPLWFNISKLSRIGFLEDSTAVYRIHNDSASSKSDFGKALDDTKKYERMINYLLSTYEYSVHEKLSIGKQVSKRYLRIALQHNKPEFARNILSELLVENYPLIISERIKYSSLLLFSRCKILWFFVYLIFKITIRAKIHRRKLSSKFKNFR